ncbi:MAG TPA: methyltransferase domain-containing protein [Bryobacteraceae bacterium]|nr:methyltransferase domain-containing protein [Bryobacteraceae bacterium]
MGIRLRTRRASTHTDVAAFFDGSASTYAEQHGEAERLLQYRLGLIRQAARFRPVDTVLEVGCGNGLHLLTLAREFGSGLGVDLSPAMIEAARVEAGKRGLEHRTTFIVDKGERLDSVADASIDVVFCIGAIEHMLDQAQVFRNAYRVLRAGGRFVCITLNGGSIWYRYLAPALGFDTRQLSTDRYLCSDDLRLLSSRAGFDIAKIDAWTFIQRGDMPQSIALLLAISDGIGKLARLDPLRGGLRLAAVKP